jgi:hypothetical protein
MQNTANRYDTALRTQAAPIHEAGHAVLAPVLKIPSGSASVIRDGLHYGWHQSADPLLTRRVWKARGKIRPDRHATDGCAMVAAAGAIAEMVLLGFNCEGHWSDVAEIERLIPDDPGNRRKARLARAVWQLVRRHQTQIESIAEMLRARGTLSRREIDRAFEIGRPVPEDE